MAAGDGTGPNGMGPMTGRGAGYCAGYNMPGYANPTSGRGMGRSLGRGRGFFGRGFGRGIAPAYSGYEPRLTNDQEKEMLGQEKLALEEELKAIKKEIEGLKK